MNKQLQTLLQDSFSYYRAKQLKKALNAAQIALEFGGENGTCSQGKVEANLLLARIYNANGRYQNEQAYFLKAAKHVEEAKALNESLGDPHFDVLVKLIDGETKFYRKKPELACPVFREGLALAQQHNDPTGIVFSLGAMSQLAISINKLDDGIRLAEEALLYLRENIRTNHTALWAEAYFHLSQAYIKKQDYSRSLEMSQELLKASRAINDIEKEVIALRNIAVVCGVKSNYNIGMQYFLEALDKCQSIGFQELQVQLQVNIGTLYAHLYNYPEAIRRYQTALAEHGDLLEDVNKVVVYNNLGNIYLSTNHPQDALIYFEQSLQLSEQSGLLSMQAHALAQLSRTNLQLRQLDVARKQAELAQAIIDESGDKHSKQINLLNWGEIFFLEMNYDLAQKYTLNAIDLAKQVKDDACEIRCYKHLSKIFKSKGDFETALEYEEKFGKIQESFAKEQYDRQFLDMEIRHAIREKQKAIEALTKENEYQALLLKKTDQIATQNQELIRVNEDLKQFAYVASHDLKEPLRMIGSFTQIIQKKIKDQLDQKDHQYFDYINGGVNRMNELLDGLLKYATVGNSQITLEEVNLNKTLLVCLNNLRVSITETGARINHPNLPTVRTNASLLIQLLQNLISNALKFTKKGETPVIEIGAFESDSETTIFVKDNGIGISAEHQLKIFEIFQRLHAREAYEGAGIGLAICQKIAARLNSRLWVESEEGAGATFYVALPNQK